MIQCLIVDDDVEDQEVFLLCIKQTLENVVCLTANSGIEALSMFGNGSQYAPHYVFIDVNMPKMNGIDCLRNLREFEHLRDTKIFMYSTTSDNAVVNLSKELGAHDFIVKPSKILEIKNKLSELLIAQE
jgi:CheY-like chemotaxis protein